jgi:hypothetical protein
MEAAVTDQDGAAVLTTGDTGAVGHRGMNQLMPSRLRAV